MKKYYDLLSLNPLFLHISKEDYPQMLSCLGAFTRSYGRKEEILSAGEPARFIGIVLSGSVQIVSTDVFGNQTIFGIMEPPELFAEAFCCAGTEHLPVTVLSVSESTILFLDGKKIFTSCKQSCPFHRLLTEQMVRILAERNIMLNQKLRFLSRRSTREKLLDYLSFMSRQSASLSFSIPFDRQGLADYLCVDRSAMSAELSRMQKEGLLSFRKNHFRLNADEYPDIHRESE